MALKRLTVVLGNMRVVLAGPLAFELTISPCIEVGDILFDEGDSSVQITLLEKQHVTASVKAVRKSGRPATLANPPVWANANPAAASIVTAPDGLSSDVQSTSDPAGGETVLTITDADGLGLPPFTFEVSVTPDPIDHFEGEVGTREDMP